MTIQTTQISDSISMRTFSSLISQLINGNPDPDNPLPHGPMDPVIRKALEHTLWVLRYGMPWRAQTAFGPSPEPWVSFGPHPEPWILAGLNPQPLPPRTLFFAAIAGQVIERAALIQETADALRSHGETQGIIIVSGYISKFVDEFELCPRIPWPFPGPRPHWLPDAPGGADLIVTGVQFEHAASQTFDGQLKQSLASAGVKLMQAGLAKLQ